MIDERVGFIGCGKMGEALVRGLLSAGVSQDHICFYDPNKSRQAYLIEEYQIRLMKTNSQVVDESDVVVIAVKPALVKEVADEIAPSVRRQKPLIISIAAGIKINTIKSSLGNRTRVARIMPNTPAVVGAGMSAYFLSSQLKDKDSNLVEKLFGTFGEVMEVDREEELDIVTGLSGSGPAYLYLFIEALADGGVKMGLKREVALKLAAQTVLGSAKMVLETAKHPGELKDEVASPGGTTIAGLSVLEENGFRGIVIKAVQEAVNRAREIGAFMERERKSNKRRRK